MKSLFTISLLLILCSCAGFTKGKGNKYFEVKVIRDAGHEYLKQQVTYFQSVKDEESCFEDNPKNKETITVDSDYKQFAIDHFFKRISKIDVTVYRVNSDVVKADVVATDSVKFDLEVAYCYYEFFPGAPWLQDSAEYVSFRLAD